MTDIPTGSETYSSAISEANNYTKWLIDLFGDRPRGNILEVGIGHGGYVPYLREKGSYFGVDISQESVDEERGKYPDVEFFVDDITSPQFGERFDGYFDSVVCINVLEHIQNDQAALANLYKVLRPGGHLLVIVPGVQSLYNDLDRLAGHYRRYSISRIKESLAGIPFYIEQLRYFNPVGGLGWYVNKFKSYDSLDDGSVNKQIAFFDKYLLPISRLSSPVFSRFFGQSLLLIARKGNGA